MTTDPEDMFRWIAKREEFINRWMRTIVADVARQGLRKPIGCWRYRWQRTPRDLVTTPQTYGDDHRKLLSDESSGVLG